MKFERILRNTSLGACIGAALAIGLSAVFRADVSEGVEKFYTYIFSALITLLASGLALMGVFSNIEHQQHIATVARLRRLRATRALLPSALSQLCELAIWGIRYSHQFAEYRRHLGTEEFERVSLSRLELSDELMSLLRDMIELCEDENVAKRIAGMLREHQVLVTRWKDEFSEARRVIQNLRTRTVYWALLHALASSLFEYARSETDTVDTVVTEDEIGIGLRAARTRGLELDEFADEIALYARHYRRRFGYEANA